MVTAAEILHRLRRAKPLPMVREVSIPDPYTQAVYRRWQMGLHPDIYGPRFAAAGLEVADTLPDGFNPHRIQLDRRIDVLILGPGEKRTAVEIKVTRADFRRDTPEKRRPWQDVTHNFVYATPPGLVRPDEVPPGCGLWEVNTDPERLYDVVTSVVRPRRNKDVQPLPDSVWRTMFGRVSRYEAADEARRLLGD